MELLGYKGGPIVGEVLAPDRPKHIVSLAFRKQRFPR